MKRFRRVVTVVIVLLLFSAVAYGDTWTANERLTTTLGDSKYPAIAVDGLKIYVVWEDNTPDLLNKEIYFKKSVDGGVTWKTDKRLTNNAGDSRYPRIAVDGSNIYVVWTDYTPGTPEIYFKKSDDGGATWRTNKRLTNNAGYSYAPAIAVDGSNIYVVWADSTPGNYEIYFKKSDDGGATWATNKKLSNTAGYSEDPAIVVDGSNIYVVWTDYTPGNYEIYFKRSVDRGATWKADKRLTNNPGGSYTPAIAVDGSNIYVVWEDDTPGNEEIYFKKSDDGGATWTANNRLTNDALGSMYPAIAADGSNVYVVWQNFIMAPANFEIYFKEGVLF
jgi:hypothetical protein